MMTHRYAWRTDKIAVPGWEPKRPTLYGRACWIVARGRMNSVMIEFADGQREIVSRFAVRRDEMSDSKLRGTRIAITCPECGPAAKMVIRQNRETGDEFLGCSNYPDCRYTEPLPETIRMKYMGIKGLFDE